MIASNSESDPPLIFVLGAPRSGTTWIQLMLGAHPSIATAQETDLFNNYIAPVCRRWNDDLHTTRARRFKGLASVLTQKEFDTAVRAFVGSVYRKVLSCKRTATMVLDKNPPYSLCPELLLRYYPRARYIHVLRDGRDVVASLLAASTTWGSSWAPRSTRNAAKKWKTHVLGAQRITGNGAPYAEVRYEDLLKQGPLELARLFDFCGTPMEPRECKTIYERFSLDNLKSSRGSLSTILWSGEVTKLHGCCPEEPPGFFREGIAGNWKNLLTKRQYHIIQDVAGDLLQQLGYDSPGETTKRRFLMRVFKRRGRLQ